MTRNAFITATISVVLSAVMLPSSRADELSDPFGANLQAPPLSAPAPLTNDDQAAQPVTASSPVVPQTAVFRRATQASPEAGPMAINPEAYAVPPLPPMVQPGYVRLGAPLYPSPRPNIPIWTGATMITSPALAPHEMLYPHTYRSIQGPFYHRVKGGWIWTPMGIRSHERWELQGTQVTVKYRSQVPHWTKSMWFPPTLSSGSGNRY